MKHSYLTIIALILLTACGNQTEDSTQTDATIKTTVNTLLNDWHKAASDADYKNYFDKMDRVSVFIGTDATENWTKQDFENYSKPHFDNGKAWDFKVLERNVYLSDSKKLAWFDENLDTKRGTFRGSGVLEKKENTWRIKHYVLSLPVPNEDMAKVVKITKKNDSIFRSKFN